MSLINISTSEATEPFAAPSKGTGLQDLPPEVFERVAAYVRPEDLAALRLVCRDTDAKVVRSYGEAHYHTVAFLLCSKESLETFISIAEKENLGRAIRTVVLCPDEVMEVSHPMPEPGPRRSRRCETVDERNSRELRELNHATATKAQLDFQNSDGPLHLLTTAFSRLGRFGKKVTVSVVTTPLVEARKTRGLIHGYYPGCESLMERTNELIRPGADLDRQISVVFDSLASSSLQVHNFTVEYDASKWHISSLVSENRFARTSQAFAGLRELHLQFTEKSPTDVDRVLGLVGSVAHALEAVSLRADLNRDMYHINISWMPRLIRECLLLNFETLKRFRLQCSNKVEMADLVDFTARHKESLDEMVVLRVLIFSPEAYHSLGQPIWRYFRLQDESLTRTLQQQTGFTVHFNQCSITDQQVTGKYWY